jgi:Ca-activated chloride channel family protein
VLTFVVDVSGSMKMEGRLMAVKKALSTLVEGLQPDDYVGIVAFSSNAWVVLPTTPVGERVEILAAIRSLQPLDSTNAEAGLRLGYTLAREAFRPDHSNRIILCSDGVANTGLTSHDAIFDVIDREARAGIALTTIGVGMGNYNDVLLEQLADQGDGMYAYIDSVDELERLFVDDLTGLLQMIAKDARIQVAFNTDTVSRYRLIGFENRAVDDDLFLDDSTDAGEIGAGHSVTALYEVKLVNGAAGEIASVSLRWLDPDTGLPDMLEDSIAVADLASSFEETTPSFQLAAIVASYAEILRESYWAQGYALDNLVPWLAALESDAQIGDQALEFMNLLESAMQLAHQA